MLDPQDPVACNDEYFYPYDGDDEVDVFPSSSTNSTRWGWKDGKWTVYSQDATVYSQPDPNTLTRTYTYLVDESVNNSETRYTKKHVNILTRKRDSRNNLLEYIESDDYVEKNDVYTFIDRLTETSHIYTYNDEGLLTSATHEEYVTNREEASVTRAAATRVLVSSIVTNYYYTELNIVNGITSTTADATKPAFAVSGRTVNTVGKSAAISLYTLDGQLVATSATGQVEAPANGIFIAVSGAAKCKIVVK